MESKTGFRFRPAVLLSAIVSVVLAGEAAAATLVVDRTDDTNAAGAQVCSGAANDCSLRGAITKANNTPGADLITFDPITNGIPFTLTIVNTGGFNEDNNFEGDLDVLGSGGSLTILGNGSAITIIQGGTTAMNGIDKVFAFNPTCDFAAAFSISDVTIRFGRNLQPFGAADFSFSGGGLDFCGTGEAGSSFSISNSVVTENTNTDGYGGGMNIDEVAPGASSVTISNTLFTLNTSKYWGGGLNIFGDNDNVTITNSTFSNNGTLGTTGAAAQGGGANIRITNDPAGTLNPTPFVTVTNSTVLNNQGVGFGGGIDVAGSGYQNVTLSNVPITGNNLIVVAGGVTNTTGGGIEHNNDPTRTTTLTNVLVASNNSNGGAAGTPSNGGGIAHGSGTMTVRNSTISGNSAKNDGGGVYVSIGPDLTLLNTTVAGNRADSDNNAGGVGGSIRKLAGAGTVTLQNTISDLNLGTSAAVNEINGAVTANFSLIANIAGATITGANNQNGASARLVALANNGAPSIGPTGFLKVLQTHALNPGSPALDGGSNAFATAAGLTTDQRGAGFVRTADAADLDTTDTVDMGAFEAHPMVEDKPDTSINEDTALSTSFSVGDSDLTSGLDTVGVSSSNTALVPNTSISVSGGSNTVSNSTSNSHTLVITPAANAFGTTTITVVTQDLQNGTTQTVTDTFVLTVTPVADIPSGTNASTNEDTQTLSGLVLTKNPVDGAEVTHFKILSIGNGTLFLNNGTTVVNVNDIITVAQAGAGLKFTPAANLYSPVTSFSVDFAAATSAGGAGLSPAATVSISVSPVADPPTITKAVTPMDTQTTSGLVVSRNAADGAEVTHFKITAINDGTLFQNDGTTPINVGDFITIADGNAGLKFTPTTGFTGNALIQIAASLDNLGTGISPSTSVNVVVASAVAAGDLVIREFRVRGPVLATDEYVVIHNRTSGPLTLGALDGSGGFAVAKEGGTLVFTIPDGTVIPAKGHFLAANTTNGPTVLGITPNATWTPDIADGLGLGLFRSAAAFTAPNLLDAVGFTPGLYAEGTVLPSLGAVGGEYAWVRKSSNGAVQDTDSNLGTVLNPGDFTLISTDGTVGKTYNGVPSVLGAPSPTGLDTFDVSSGLTLILAEPNVGPNNAPNRIRLLDAPGGGDRLEFRRRITNNTSSTFTSLRIRFTEATVVNSPGYATPSQADIRPNTSVTVTITTSLGSPISPLGLTLLTPPAQASFGGLNSILTIPGGPLGPGQSRDINIALKVFRGGNYRFFTSIEAK